MSTNERREIAFWTVPGRGEKVLWLETDGERVWLCDHAASVDVTDWVGGGSGPSIMDEVIEWERDTRRDDAPGLEVWLDEGKGPGTVTLPSPAGNLVRVRLDDVTAEAVQ